MSERDSTPDQRGESLADKQIRPSDLTAHRARALFQALIGCATLALGGIMGTFAGALLFTFILTNVAYVVSPPDSPFRLVALLVGPLGGGLLGLICGLSLGVIIGRRIRSGR